MTNFFINNGNKIDLLQLKEGNAINFDDKFLRKYDTNNNSVWDNDEIKQFLSDLESADINGDGKIDKNESITWYSRVTNIAIEKVKLIFNNNDNNRVYESLGNILRENAEEQSIAGIRQNVKEGLNIYQVSIGGVVSKGVNSIKELFNTEYAGDKVYRQLVKKQVSSWLLEKAHISKGLIAKEYVQEKMLLLKALLGTEKLSATEQINIEQSINNIDFNQLDTYILRLSNAENNEYNKLQRDVINDLMINNNLDNNKDLGLKKIKLNSVGAFLSSSKAEEKMSFDKIFELEMGVSFNQNNSIQEYENKYLETNAVVTIHNKVTQINEDLTENIRIMDGYNKHGSTTGMANEREMLYKNLSNSILSALQKFYGDDQEKISEILTKYNAKLENNIITFGVQNEDYAIVNIAKQIQEMINTNLSKLMNGKTLEGYQEELKKAYYMAYGAKNSVDLASKFQESQQEGVGYAKIGISTAGIALAVLSDGTLLPITGMLIGAFGPGLVSGVESATKEGGMTKDEANEMTKELVMSGVLTFVGMKEGEIATKIGHILMKSCPKFVQYIGEYGSMAVMGALTDYALMGDIDLTQESISNLINIATGIIAHRKIIKMQEQSQIKQLNVEIEASAADDFSIINKLMNKIKHSEEISNTREEIINSIEFKELLPENQNLLLKTIDDYATIKGIIGQNVSDVDVLLDIKMIRNCSNEDIKNLSDILGKNLRYKNEILDIVKSNYNIKFGEALDGNIASHIDDIIKLIEANPNYKEQIVDYIKVQRRANNDTSNPTTSIDNYINTLNKYPEHQDFIIELTKNGNLDAKSTDGGINTIEAALNLYIKSGYKKEDILILARQNYTVQNIRSSLATIKKYPELRDIILNESPVYKLIDNTPANTSNDIIEKRSNIKEYLELNYPNEMKQLKQTLGEKFFLNVKWEEIISTNATRQDAELILNTLNESSKFFARTSFNEQLYGKNIQWASKMNDISNGAEYLISQGKEFDSVLSYISHEYHAYDEATTLETNLAQRNDRRLASGKYRGDDVPNQQYITPFEQAGSYAEYFDRFTNVENPRKRPYEDVHLTSISCFDDNTGTMYHPQNKYVEPGLNYVWERYNELRPLFDKVKNNQKLSKQDISYANEKIAEIYFLMANVMPYERGSNGISDILMRSIYKGLGVNQPALKHGVSLDLEAFCMDLNEYKNKWNSFFENN